MNRSITRGLAVSAVSALAVTGLSLVAAPAHAAAPEVELLSQLTGVVPTTYDTYDRGNHLTARVEAPANDVVGFEVNPDPEAGDSDPGWRAVDGSPRVTGNYVSLLWQGFDRDARSYRGERVALRAVATNTDGTSYSTRNNVEVVDDGSVENVSVTTQAASYFLQPYVESDRTSATIPVYGTTSATDGTVGLSTWRRNQGVFVGQTAADVEPFEEKVPGEDRFETYGRFTGLIELTAFDIEEGAVAVAAERDSDDVAPIALTAQQISYVWATTPAPVRAGERADVTIRVADQNQEYIRGAEVRRASDDSLVGYTDGSGVVTADEAGDTEETYYANATDADPFDAGDGDVTSGPVTVATYEPDPSYAQPVFGDGTAFDVDEYEPGDLALAVADSQGRPVGADESVSYRVYPSDEPAPATYRTALTNEDGVAVVDFDPTDASGDYTLAYVLTDKQDTESEQTRTFTTGEAELLLSPKASPVVEAAGGQIDYFGRLVLNGEPLPNRRVDLSYERGIEVVPGNSADAGIVTAKGRRLQASRTTNDHGSFRVTIDDRAENPQASEIEGVLTASTGDTVPTGDSTVDGNADAATTSVTRFGSGAPGAARITLRGTGNGADANRLKVTGPTSLSGESIKVFRVNARGKRVLVKTKTLNRTGDRPAIVVADGNGRARTTYVVRLLASQRVQATDSNTKALR